MERLTTILVEQLGVDEIEVSPVALLGEEGLGTDSLDCVELVMAVEEEFDLEISDEDADKMKSVQDVLDYLTPRVATK